MITRVSADFLIIGSGIAGLRAAASLAVHGRVVLLTKSDPRAGSTGYAQGGIAAAVGADDTPARHAEDTFAAGDGLCDPDAVRVLVEDGPRDVQELIAWGAAFDRAEDGSPALAREGAHSVRRVLHAHDATGREIGRALAAHVAELPSVTVLDHALAIGAHVVDDHVAGARFLTRDGSAGVVDARATLLATGGAGQVYRETTNPPVATGDGIAFAYLAGARVADMEFVQFHPTALAVPNAPRYLLSEALRGEGARLINNRGERFMPRYDPAGDLAPRDRVARALELESRRTGAPVYLTMTHMPAAEVHERFPLITDLCRRVGLDLATDRIPVGPAAHYLMGGVQTDLEGRTSVPGLFAAGEVACTGVHGANRLASNSLLEGLVFGARAGEAMSAWNGRDWPVETTPIHADPASSDALSDHAPLRDSAFATPGDSRRSPFTIAALSEPELRDLMWRSAGVFRDRAGLQAALDRLDEAWAEVSTRLARGLGGDADHHRLVSLVIVGRLIARAALRREESRGAHSRTDFPERDDLHWKRHCTDVRA